MPDRYTEEEIEYLKERYPVESNKQVAEELNRSINSVKVKAYKLGIQKADDTTVVSRKLQIDNYSNYVDNYDVKNTEMARFVCGLVTAEGSFIMQKMEGRTKFYFSIGMSVRDSDLVRYLEDFFEIGNISISENTRDNQQDTIMLRVTSEKELIEEIIPFMQKNLRTNTSKWLKYKEWRNMLLSKNNFKL